MSDKPNEMDISVLYPSKYLRCADLKGKNVTVTIIGVTNENVPMKGGKKEKKVVLSLAKTAKQIIVGKTNGYALGLLLSTNAADWKGHRIVLCPDVTRFGREDVACIRILGSPDASPERSAAYAKAWRGDRKGGELVSRLKQAVALMQIGDVPPVEPAIAEPEEPVPADGAPPEPDMFEDDLNGEIRAPAEAPAARTAKFDPKSVEQWEARIDSAIEVADCVELGTALGKANGAYISVQAFGKLEARLYGKVNELKAVNGT